MANSSPVAPGDQATATQYNNLRSDVVDPTSGHRHDGLGAVAALLALLGDGSDGDVTISGNTTLTRDMYYNTLTVNAGVVLTTDGYRLFVLGTCNVLGTIRNNGNTGSLGANGFDAYAGSGVSWGGNTANAPGGAGATGGTARTLPAGGPGGAGATGGTTAYDSGTNSPGNNSTGPSLTNQVTTTASAAGGPGGAGGNTGGAGGTSSAGAAGTLVTKGQSRSLIALGSLIPLDSTTAYTAPGGAGGAGGGAKANQAAGGGGGGGGAGGGCIFLICRTLAGNGTIEAKGGAGGAGGAGGNGGAQANRTGGGGGGGGAGGTGGVILLAYPVKTFTGTLSVAGGAGGAAGAAGLKSGTGFDGVAGQPGNTGNAGRLIQWSLP